MMNLNVRDRLDAGRPVLGTFVKVDSPAVVELIGLAGFDFVIIDTEHGNFTHAQVENLIRAAETTGMSAIVRTPSGEESPILHALDSGAAGVQVPGLSSGGEAARAVRHARYHPLGQRGFARANRAADYGAAPLDAYFAQAARTLLIVHVENREMVEDIEALCALDGIDMIFLGAADLSQSYGAPGAQDDLKVRTALDRVTATALAAGRHVGAVASSTAEMDALIEKGVRYIVWQSDIAMLRGALQTPSRHFAQLRG
ncbi:HpcH/HpaI aldolase family protein [Sphingomonas soli]|uniref:HpcH/HpaI aldolase family protein n=1 Tax=Sphingomonas soli TaxID=266127 RepID=UPI000AB93983|nr:aldolase/citrate lyase family protein [Sphingomonas soli]